MRIGNAKDACEGDAVLELHTFNKIAKERAMIKKRKSEKF
jgi:hypothetical protein